MGYVRKQFLGAVILIISLFFLVSPGLAQVQSYPKKPITIIVSAEPGAASDAAGRIIAPYLTKKWGVSVMVVNKPGGAAIPGTLEAIQSQPDGYTMLIDGHAYSTFRYVIMKDLAPVLMKRTSIAKVFSVPVFYIVRADAPWKTLSEVMEYARKDPKTFKWGAGGIGSILNFATTQLFSVAGIDPAAGRVIMDGGQSVCLTALLGGHIKLGIGMMPDIQSLYPSKIRALAVTTPERIKETYARNIPTTKEAGFPGANMVGWYGVSGPPKLPDDIINLWEKTLSDGSRNPEFQELAARVGHPIHFVGRKDMEVDLKEEYKMYLNIAEKIGLIKR